MCKNKIHPDWYYIHYNLLFDRKDEYSKEISIINERVDIHNKVIQEIGPGIGGHVNELLKHKPSSLSVVDFDPEACKILDQKYGNSLESILNKNGFYEISDSNFDVVICMNSIVQQVKTHSEVIKRINSINQRLKSGGSLFVEFIDGDNSSQVFPNDFSSNILQTADSVVTISSKYFSNHFLISFKGHIKNENINYKVELQKIQLEYFIKNIDPSLWSKVEFIPLDIHSRRNLIWLTKN